MIVLVGREREWWAKAQTHVLRLAGTLSYLSWAIDGGEEPKFIESDIMQAAIRLVRNYFWPHSRAALRQIGINQPTPMHGVSFSGPEHMTRTKYRFWMHDVKHLANVLTPRKPTPCSTAWFRLDGYAK